MQANQLNEEREKIRDAAFDSLGHKRDEDKSGRVKSSIPATMDTKSLAKGIHGENMSSAAPYLPNHTWTLFPRPGLWNGMILLIPYSPKRYPTDAPRTDAGISTSEMTS